MRLDLVDLSASHPASGAGETCQQHSQQDTTLVRSSGLSEVNLNGLPYLDARVTTIDAGGLLNPLTRRNWKRVGIMTPV
jgi:hypothetical protein